MELQQKLVFLFNNFLSKKRKEMFSLFLSQYREFARKRISFNLVYDIISHLYKSGIESGKNRQKVNNNQVKNCLMKKKLF